MTEEHGIEVLTCPQCGATPVVDEKTHIAVCEYCGAKFLLPEEEHFGYGESVPAPQEQWAAAQYPPQQLPPLTSENNDGDGTRPGIWMGWTVFCILFGIFGMSQFSDSGDILDILLGGAFVVSGLFCLFGYFAAKKWDLSLRAPAILFFCGDCFTAMSVQSYSFGDESEGWITLLLGLVLIVFCVYLTITRLRKMYDNR